MKTSFFTSTRLKLGLCVPPDSTWLGLVGVTAMLLAAKYEEIYVPSILDFVYITNKAYKSTRIWEMEQNILKKLNFVLGWPLLLHFPEESSQSFRSTSVPGSLGIGLNWVQDQIREVGARKVVHTVQQNYYVGLGRTFPLHKFNTGDWGGGIGAQIPSPRNAGSSLSRFGFQARQLCSCFEVSKWLGRKAQQRVRGGASEAGIESVPNLIRASLQGKSSRRAGDWRLWDAPP